MKKGQVKSAEQIDATFCSNYSIVPVTGCWLWMGAIDSNGYPRLYRHYSSKVMAHRYAYERAKGPTPHGLVVDHLCRHPWCVNPDHLEAVPQGTNVLRGMSPWAVNARKDKCSRGHAFDSANTATNSGGWRRCRACDRDKKRVIRQRMQQDATLPKHTAWLPPGGGQ